VRGVGAIRIKLRYRGHVYSIENGFWRGPSGRGVHLLTWVTDDLERIAPEVVGDDHATARKVAETLGGGAEVLVEPEPWE